MKCTQHVSHNWNINEFDAYKALLYACRPLPNDSQSPSLSKCHSYSTVCMNSAEDSFAAAQFILFDALTENNCTVPFFGFQSIKMTGLTLCDKNLQTIIVISDGGPNTYKLHRNTGFTSQCSIIIIIIIPWRSLSQQQRNTFLGNKHKQLSRTFLLLMSAWLRLMTPIMPSFTGITRPHRTSTASVPWSIRSSFVITAKVRRPSITIQKSMRRSLIPVAACRNRYGLAKYRTLQKRQSKNLVLGISSAQISAWNETKHFCTAYAETDNFQCVMHSSTLHNMLLLPFKWSVHRHAQMYAKIAFMDCIQNRHIRKQYWYLQKPYAIMSPLSVISPTSFLHS